MATNVTNGDGFQVTGQGAGTLGPWKVKGGKYLAVCTATFSAGNCDLQILGPDGSTYISLGSSTKFSAAGTAVVDLPAATVQLVITTSTAVQYSLTLIRGPAGGP